MNFDFFFSIIISVYWTVIHIDFGVKKGSNVCFLNWVLDGDVMTHLIW